MYLLYYLIFFEKDFQLRKIYQDKKNLDKKEERTRKKNMSQINYLIYFEIGIEQFLKDKI